MASSVKVSVIIPFFNSALFLKNCLDALSKQSLKEIEIILINDGSKDGSADTVDIYQKGDPRIKLLNQQNMGPGSARNKGIMVAIGEYVTFVDSDDIPFPDYCESLFDEAVNNQADIVVSRFESFFGSATVAVSTIGSNDLSQKEVIKKMYQGRISMAVCSKLYRTKLLQDNNILFPDSLYIEDRHFFLKAVLHAGKVWFMDRIIYQRVIRSSSTMNKVGKKHIEDSFQILELDLSLLQQHQMEESLAYYLFFCDLKVLVFIYAKLGRSLEKEKENKLAFLAHLGKLDFQRSSRFFQRWVLQFFKGILLTEISLRFKNPFCSKVFLNLTNRIW